MMDPTERYQIQRSSKSAECDRMSTGIVTRMMRTAEAIRDGTVLPIAWNMLEATKIRPDATKFQEMMRRYSSPIAITAGSSVKTSTIAAGAMWQRIAKTNITPAAISAASLNVAFTRSGKRAPKFWPATGATEKPSATTGMKPD